MHIASFFFTEIWKLVNPSSRKSRKDLFYIVIAMVADGLTMHGARSSAAMILAQCARNDARPVWWELPS